jgi:hypothetical protein
MQSVPAMRTRFEPACKRDPHRQRREGSSQSIGKRILVTHGHCAIERYPAARPPSTRLRIEYHCKLIWGSP